MLSSNPNEHPFFFVHLLSTSALFFEILPSFDIGMSGNLHFVSEAETFGFTGEAFRCPIR